MNNSRTVDAFIQCLKNGLTNGRYPFSVHDLSYEEAVDLIRKLEDDGSKQWAYDHRIPDEFGNVIGFVTFLRNGLIAGVNKFAVCFSGIFAGKIVDHFDHDCKVMKEEIDSLRLSLSLTNHAVELITSRAEEAEEQLRTSINWGRQALRPLFLWLEDNPFFNIPVGSYYPEWLAENVPVIMRERHDAIQRAEAAEALCQRLQAANDELAKSNRVTDAEAECDKFKLCAEAQAKQLNDYQLAALSLLRDLSKPSFVDEDVGVLLRRSVVSFLKRIAA